MEKKHSVAKTIGITGAVAAAAAAAGAYWFYGSVDAKKHRKQVKSFMLKARGEVLATVEKAKDIDKAKYYAIVEKVVGRYASAAGVTAAEVAEMTRDLKNTWVHMHAAHKAAAAPAKAKKLPAKKK